MKLNRRLTSLIICIGFICWGAYVDSFGKPVSDQILFSLFFGFLALYLKED